MEDGSPIIWHTEEEAAAIGAVLFVLRNLFINAGEKEWSQVSLINLIDNCIAIQGVGDFVDTVGDLIEQMELNGE